MSSQWMNRHSVGYFNGNWMLTAVEKCGARRRKIAALGVKKYQGLDYLWC